MWTKRNENAIRANYDGVIYDHYDVNRRSVIEDLRAHPSYNANENENPNEVYDEDGYTKS